MLSEKLLAEICQSIQPVDVDWDYRECLTADQLASLITDREALWKLECELWDYNLDYIYDLEKGSIRNAIEFHSSDIEEEIGEDSDVDELIDEYWDDFMDYVQINLNVHELIRNSGGVNVRIELHSNFDCLNSFWLCSQYAFEYEGYLKDAIDALHINPQELKKFLVEQGHECEGRWPNKKTRRPLVTCQSFYDEFQNTGSGANLLTIIGKIDPSSESFINGKGVITIPEGQPVGFYDSFNGGGSMFDAVTQREIKIDLNDSDWSLVADESNEYSMSRVYGVSDDFFQEELTYN